MISIEGIELPNLIIEDEFAWVGLEAEVTRTLGGNVLIWEREINGKPINLVGGSDFGWITRLQLKSLFAIASVPRSVYSLDYNGILYQVRFRSEDKTPIEATPLVPRTNYEDTDYYNNVKLKLMEV